MRMMAQESKLTRGTPTKTWSQRARACPRWEAEAAMGVCSSGPAAEVIGERVPRTRHER